MKKVIASSILFVLIWSSLNGQENNLTYVYNIEGSVKALNNTSIPHADILIMTSGENNYIIAHTISDSKGLFRIDVNSTQKKIAIKASCIGFKGQLKYITNQSTKEKYLLDFNLEEETKQLQEVFISAKPKVQLKNDTTIFNLQNIVNGSERVVEDILRKLPGIELQHDGTFKFKGKKVDLVLVDGENLFDKGYTIGTKNIRANHINNIEAYENYSENPFLRGIEITDKVALNLKFKDGFNISNKVKFGAGTNEKRTLDHVGIALSKKIKSFNYFNHNNLGTKINLCNINPISYLNQINNNNPILLSKVPTFLNTSTINSLKLAQNSKNNNTFFESLNILPSLSESTKLRANINYYSDRANNYGQSQTIINTSADSILIKQSQIQNLKPNYLIAKLNYKEYQGRIFFENNMIYSRLNNSNEQKGITNNENQELKSKSKEIYFLNSTSLLKKINSKKILKFQGSVCFNKAPEELFIKPGIDLNKNQIDLNITNRQNIKSDKLSIKVNSDYYYKTNNNNRFTFSSGISFYKSSLKSLLQNNSFTFSQNDNKLSRKEAYIKIKYYKKFKQLVIQPNLSFTQVKNNYSYPKNLNSIKKHTLLVDGKLGLTYHLRRYSILSFFVQYSEKLPNDKYLFNNYILISNRSILKNNLSFKKTTSSSYSLSFNHYNLLKEFTAYFSLGYNKLSGEYLTQLFINQDLSQTIYSPSSKENTSYSLMSNVSKYINSVGLKISLSTTLNQSIYYNFLNNLDLRKNKVNSINSSFNVETNYIWKFIVMNNTLYGNSKYLSKSNQSISNQNINNRFTILFTPTKQLTMKFTHSYLMPSLSNNKLNSANLDGTIEYENRSKTILYRIQGINLLKNKDKNTIINSDYYQTTNKNLNIDRFLLFSLEFRF